MIGTLINVVTVLVGGALGTFLGSRLPDKMRQTVIYGLGLVTAVVGMQAALSTQNVLLIMGCVLFGGVLGEWWRIDAGLEALGRWLEDRFGGKRAEGDERSITRAFVTASLVFCVGPMTVLGSIQDGLTGDYTLLAIKSVLDGFSSLAYAAAMGMGVTFAAISVLAVQGTLTLGASLFETVLTDAMMTELTASGGVIMLGIGLLMLDVKRIKVANFLPALIVAPLLVVLWEFAGLQ